MESRGRPARPTPPPPTPTPTPTPAPAPAPAPSSPSPTTPLPSSRACARARAPSPPARPLPPSLSPSPSTRRFNQPARKDRRRKARAAKAAAIFPRPTSGPLRPVVRGQTVKYNLRRRAGRGFTLAELKEAGVPAKAAPGIGIAVDHRRRNRSLESLQENAARLAAYKAALVVFPRKAGKPKAGDAADAKAGSVAQARGALLPITRAAPALATAAVDASGPRAFYTLRLERTNARLAGMRKKRAEDAEAEEKNAAK